MAVATEKKGISAGSYLKYCAESTAGTRPTSGYTQIRGVSAIPAINTDLATEDATTIDAKNRQYVLGLPDSGGAIQLSVYESEAFREDWDTMKAAYDALSGGKQMWFEIAYPEDLGLDSYYMPVQPADLGFGGMDVGSVLANTPTFAVVGDCVFATAST